VRAVNYSTEKVTVFKNQKLGVVEHVDEFVELHAMPEEYQGSRAIDLESTDTDEDQKQQLGPTR